MVKLNFSQDMIDAMSEWTGPASKGGVFRTPEKGLDWLLSFFLESALPEKEQLHSLSLKKPKDKLRYWVN